MADYFPPEGIFPVADVKIKFFAEVKYTHYEIC